MNRSGRLDPMVAPRRNPHVAWLRVEDSAVLCTESNESPIILDPVSAELWEQFDGMVTIWALAEDLASIDTRPVDEHLDEVEWLVRALASDRFLEFPSFDTPTLPRRMVPEIPPDSCVGRRMGMGRMCSVDVEAPNGSVLRVGATVEGLAAEIGDRIGRVDPFPSDRAPDDALLLRATRSATGRSRTQFLMDGVGNVLSVTRDYHQALSGLARSAAAVLDPQARPWLSAMALTNGEVIAILHPRLRDIVTVRLRQLLAFNGVDIVPTIAFFPAHEEIRTSADPLTGESGHRWPLVGVVVPESRSRVGLLRELCALAGRWDQDHLKMIDEIFRSGCVVEIDLAQPMEAIAAGLIDVINRGSR